MSILVTGSCGFIGFHLTKSLLDQEKNVYGIDTINNYYDNKLKYQRLKILRNYKNFKFSKVDISNASNLKKIFDQNKFSIVINLAAYAGVQYSQINPEIYFRTNEIGFFNILENSKRKKIKKIIFASSSSVAGNNANEIFDEDYKTDSPISLYAATKKNNEVIAHYYAVNYKIKIIGVRFFTVYGPYGRPDLSIYKFADLINKNKKITLNNSGYHFRDFTYIDDVIEAINRLIKLKKFHYKDEKKNKFFQIFNLGGGNKIKITKIVNILSKLSGKKPKIKYGPFKKGDIIFSRSSTDKTFRNINFVPNTSITKGIELFYKWLIKKNK